MRYLSLAVLLIGSLAAARAERLPVEDFSHEEAFSGMALAPDGKDLVYGQTLHGDNRLFIRDVATGKQLGIELEGSDASWSHASSYFWVNNRRLVFSAHGRWAAIDRDGKHAVYALAGGEPVYLFRDEKEGIMLVNSYDAATPYGMKHVYFWVPDRPYILKVNTRVGVPMRHVENPGNVVAWGVNPQGVATVAVEIKGTQYRAIYRADESAPWETLKGMDWTDPQVRPLGFSGDGRTLYVTRITPSGTWGVYPYDLSQRRLGELMLGHERFDIIPGHGRVYASGLYQQMAVYSDKERELLGFRYVTEFPRTYWVDPGMAQLQAAMDQALPQKINTIVSFSDDRKHLMVYSWTATDPGTFYHFDVTAQKLEKIVAARPWIDPAKMADVAPVRFKARDGLMINGYLTFPRGREPKHLPLVVLTQSSPWERAAWSFNSTAQFLANRGYAVLQVNARGSSGYGEGFRNLAQKRLGREVQWDVADGVKWAIRQGLADPARVGILGMGSLGGYSALMGLVVEPDLYCCGLAMQPYTDLVKVIDKSDMDPDGFAYASEWIGDPATDSGLLRETSPLYRVGDIKAAVFLGHDSDEDDWSFNQTKAMSAALKKAGRDVVFKTNYHDRRYGFERHAKLLTDIEEFLASHMPAEAPAAK